MEFPGEGGCKTENLPWEEYGYFLELYVLQAKCKAVDKTLEQLKNASDSKPKHSPFIYNNYNYYINIMQWHRLV